MVLLADVKLLHLLSSWKVVSVVDIYIFHLFTIKSITFKLIVYVHILNVKISFAGMSTPSPMSSAQNISSIRSSQTSQHKVDDFNEFVDSEVDNASLADNKSEEKIICCNTCLVQALKSPELVTSLTLLSDPSVVDALHAIKDKSGFTGSLANMPVQTSNAQCPQMPTPSSLGLFPPNTSDHNSSSRASVKIEPDQSDRPLSLDDFDRIIGSPKSKCHTPKRSIIDSPKAVDTAKKFKPNTVPTIEQMIQLSEIK